MYKLIASKSQKPQTQRIRCEGRSNHSSQWKLYLDSLTGLNGDSLNTGLCSVGFYITRVLRITVKKGIALFVHARRQ
jgi:hypothetical protein